MSVNTIKEAGKKDKQKTSSDRKNSKKKTHTNKTNKSDSYQKGKLSRYFI